MGQFGMTLEEALRNTPRAFFYYQRAYQVELHEKMFLESYGAWQNQVAKSTKGNGNNKPKFTTFNEFYDYDGGLNTALRGEKKAVNTDKDIHGLTMADRNYMISQALRSNKVRNKKEKEVDKKTSKEVTTNK